MNKLFNKIAALSVGLAMAIGVGVAIGSKSDVRSVKAENEVYYTLTPASTGGNSSPHNSYTAAATTTIGGIGWSVTGNSNMVPWRIGGKSISGVDRDVHSTTAMGSAITEVQLDLGAASNCTVNSVTLSVGSAESGTDRGVVTKNSGALYNTTLTFNPSSGSEWATSSFFTFTINVTVSGSSNKFVVFSEARFYRAKSASSTYTVTYDLNGGSGTSDIPVDNNEYDSGDTVTVLGIGDVTKTGYTFINWSDGTDTYDEGDTFEITTNTTLTAQWYHNDAISVVSGKESNEIYNGDSLNLSTCVAATGDGALSFNVPSVSYLTYDSSTTTVTAHASNVGGPLTITAYKGTQHVDFTVTVVAKPATGTFELFEDTLVEGDYVVCSGTSAMKNVTTSSPRIDAETVTIESDDSIVNPSPDIVWHIAPDGDYWTFYNDEVSKYAAFNSTDGRGVLIASATDYARFSVSGTFDFINKGKTTKNYLRYNSGYGFASYANTTGVTLTLYKKTGGEVAADSVTVKAHDDTSSLSLVRGTSGTIASILKSFVWAEDGETLATNQHVTWSCENAAGVITFDNENGTYSVSGAFDATTRIYATSVDGSIKSSNYVTLTVIRPTMPYTLIPGTNGFSDSAETTDIVWTNEVQYYDVYYMGVHFHMDGTNTTGQYNSNYKNWRMYQTGNSTITITVPSGQTITAITFDYDTKNNTDVLLDPSGTSIDSEETWTPSSECQYATFSVGQTGDKTNGQVQFNSIAVSFAAAQDPLVTINALQGELTVNDTGSFGYSTERATKPSVTWSTSDATVIRIDNSSTGAFTALSYGVATITATMTCTEGGDTDTLQVAVNAGLITITQANTICSALSSNQVTGYKVTLSGFISQKNNSYIFISDARVDGEGVTTGNTIEIYGTNTSAFASYNTILNGTITVTGKLTKYGSTNEMAAGFTIDSYTDDAIQYAHDAYASLTATCEAYGPYGITDSQWNGLSDDFDDLDTYAQAKLRSSTVEDTNQDIANWMTRYKIIVEQGGKSDFMTVGLTPGASSRIDAFGELDITKNGGALIIVIVSMLSVMALGGYFLLKKKKTK